MPGLSDAVIERTIRLRRSVRMKLPDAIIAATAFELDAAVVTHDRRDFARVPGLRVVDPLPPTGPDPGPSTVREPPSTRSGQARVRYRKTSARPATSRRARS